MRVDVGEGAALGSVQAVAPARIEIWGGLECTVARIGDEFRDLLVETGHRDRPEDLDHYARSRRANVSEGHPFRSDERPGAG